MRAPMILVAVSVCLPLQAARAQSASPPDALIIAMAQQFVLEHFERPADRHFDIAFDIANIHPQPQSGYWAVIGGFMADAGASDYHPHGYGVAMRLICGDHDKPKCWQLEKLVIDRKIILNN